jgi:hypothetical protein
MNLLTTIAQIIRDGRGYAGSNRAWRCHKSSDSDPFVGQEYELWHYSTRMLHWLKTSEGTVIPLHASTGHGSVSDQGGMNTAFKVLGLPYRYDRDYPGGGPRITDIYDPGDGIPNLLTPRVQPLAPTPNWKDAMRWTPKDGDDEIAEWRKILDEGR